MKNLTEFKAFFYEFTDAVDFDVMAESEIDRRIELVESMLLLPDYKDIVIDCSGIYNPINFFFFYCDEIALTFKNGKINDELYTELVYNYNSSMVDSCYEQHYQLH